MITPLFTHRGGTGGAAPAVVVQRVTVANWIIVIVVVEAVTGTRVHRVAGAR